MYRLQMSFVCPQIPNNIPLLVQKIVIYDLRVRVHVISCQNKLMFCLICFNRDGRYVVMD